MTREIITSMPGTVYQHVMTTYPDMPITTLSVRRHGRGTAAHVSMPLESATRLCEALERSHTLSYVAAGTSEQLRTVYAVSQYADRLARQLKRVRV